MITPMITIPIQLIHIRQPVPSSNGMGRLDPDCRRRRGRLGLFSSRLERVLRRWQLLLLLVPDEGRPRSNYLMPLLWMLRWWRVTVHLTLRPSLLLPLPLSLFIHRRPITLLLLLLLFTLSMIRTPKQTLTTLLSIFPLLQHIPTRRRRPHHTRPRRWVIQIQIIPAQTNQLGFGSLPTPLVMTARETLIPSGGSRGTC